MELEQLLTLDRDKEARDLFSQLQTRILVSLVRVAKLDRLALRDKQVKQDKLVKLVKLEHMNQAPQASDRPLSEVQTEVQVKQVKQVKQVRDPKVLALELKVPLDHLTQDLELTLATPTQDSVLEPTVVLLLNPVLPHSNLLQEALGGLLLVLTTLATLAVSVVYPILENSVHQELSQEQTSELLDPPQHLLTVSAKRPVMMPSTSKPVKQTLLKLTLSPLEAKALVFTDQALQVSSLEFLIYHLWTPQTVEPML